MRTRACALTAFGFAEVKSVCSFHLLRTGRALLPSRPSASRLAGTLGLPAEPVIDQDQGQHRFAHGDESWQQARVMATPGDDLGGLTLARDRSLGLGQAAGWFEGHPADNWLAARNAAQHSAVAIGFGAD